jgi:hypothetical protein
MIVFSCHPAFSPVTQLAQLPALQASPGKEPSHLPRPAGGSDPGCIAAPPGDKR